MNEKMQLYLLQNYENVSYQLTGRDLDVIEKTLHYQMFCLKYELNELFSNIKKEVLKWFH